MKFSLSTMFFLLATLMVAGAVFGAAITFEKPLPDPTKHTLGQVEQLRVQKEAMQELRTKMENWAAFTGYSSGTGR